MSQKKILKSKTIFENESKDVDETTGRPLKEEMAIHSTCLLETTVDP